LLAPNHQPQVAWGPNYLIFDLSDFPSNIPKPQAQLARARQAQADHQVS
jgi:hypothetical protein